MSEAVPHHPAPSDRLTDDDQLDITQLCLTTGLLPLQHGAESALVESVPCRLGHALGTETTELMVLPNSLSVTTVHAGHAVTLVRRSVGVVPRASHRVSLCSAKQGYMVLAWVFLHW